MDRPRETRRKGCVGLHIVISNQSGKPIYEQIVEQVKALIISGELKEGDALPSMRLLAKELRISVITTKRAYEELEREGFLYSQTGKGSFVAGKDKELIREAPATGGEGRPALRHGERGASGNPGPALGGVIFCEGDTYGKRY